MRRQNKLLTILMIIVMSALALFGCTPGGGSEAGTSFTVHDLKKPVYEDNFEIMTFGDHHLSAERGDLLTYKAAGMNTYNYYPTATSVDGVVAAMELCEEIGLDMIIFGGSPLSWGIDTSVYPDAYGLFPNYFKQFDDKGIDFNEYPALKGFYFIDEPGADLYDDIVEHYVSWFNQKYPDKLWHVNLFPSYATNDQLNTKKENGLTSFEVYVKRYAEEVVSKVNGNQADIGVDHYPLKKRGTTNFIHPDYLNDLITVSQAAHNVGVDFASCIQAASWGDYRLPDKPEDIRFQVYTNLAMGATRLEYYPYNVSLNPEMDGMFDQGAPSSTYYAVQEVNQEVFRFDHVLGAFDWQGLMTVFGTINHNVSIGFEDIEDKVLSRLEGIRSISATYDAIAGQFKDANGNQGYMFVNYTEPSSKISNTVSVEFNQAKGVMMYRDGIEIVLKTNGNKIDIPLQPGEGVFVIPLNELIA